MRRAEMRSAVPRAAVLTIVNPADGATYSIDPTLRREFQTLSLKAATDATGPITWSINGRPAGSSSRGASVDWPLVPGKHRIEARDASGRTATSNIVVR